MYTIWAKIKNNIYCRVKHFDNEILAEGYLAYLDYFCELNPELDIIDLYLKSDTAPVYQIMCDQEIFDQDLFFEHEEIIDEIRELSQNNPYQKFEIMSIQLEIQSDRYLEITGL